MPPVHPILRLEDAGMTRRMLEGAADMFEMLAKTPLAKETPEESKEKGRTGKEIVKALARPVLAHRLLVSPEAQLQGVTSAQVLDQILEAVPVPTTSGM